MSGSGSLSCYEQNAAELSTHYEAAHSDELYRWAADLLPHAGALAFDVGAGTGRDAAWLATRGCEVVALEPSTALREVGERLHPGAGIRWVDDALPSLAAITKTGLSFDLIILSAAWQHVARGDRPRAFRKLTALLRPSGLVLLSLRLGPAEAERAMHEVTLGEVETLARHHGLARVTLRSASKASSVTSNPSSRFLVSIVSITTLKRFDFNVRFSWGICFRSGLEPVTL